MPNEGNLRPNVLIEPEGLAGSAWRAGSESGLSYKTVLESGDWMPYAPAYEDQTRPGFDSVSCVTYSALNTIEAQLNLMLKKGLPPKVLSFLEANRYFENGKFNFSDRFSAIMSGTTIHGNYMTNAPDSFRRDGLIPEYRLPFPEDLARVVPYRVAISRYLDRSSIDQGMIDLGKRFLEHFDIRYENIWYGHQGQPDLDIVRKHLKQAPLHFAAAVCSGENDMPVIGECGCGSSHARALMSVDDVINVYDSFNKAHKKMAHDFCIPYLYKIVITLRSEQRAIPAFSYTFDKLIAPQRVIEQEGLAPNDPNEVTALQRTLQLLTNATGKPFLNREIIPVANFGPLTTQAVIDFQIDRDVATLGEIRIAGGRVGPKTRAALNQALLEAVNNS